MSLANKALPMKSCPSLSAIKKLPGQGTTEAFAALIGANMDVVGSWESSTNAELTCAERLTNLARSEPERYRDWRLVGSITIGSSGIKTAIEKIRDADQQASERRKQSILPGA